VSILKNGWMAPARVKATFAAAVGLPALWLPACYLSWVGKGCHFTPFISDLDLYPPETSIFTVGLSGTGLLMMLLMLDLFLIRRASFRVHGLGGRWLLLNAFCLLPGFCASLGCIALAFTPWNESFLAHVRQSDAIFYGGILWCAIATAGSWKLGRVRRSVGRVLPWRLAGTLFAAGCLGGMIYFAGQFFFSPSFDLDALVAESRNMSAFCHSMSQPVLSTAALFEWGLAFGLLFTIGTFWPEFAQK
jgi:hypothetical protein